MVVFSVYNTCTFLFTTNYHVDADLDAFDNVISANELSPEMLTSQSQKSE